MTLHLGLPTDPPGASRGVTILAAHPGAEGRSQCLKFSIRQRSDSRAQPVRADRAHLVHHCPTASSPPVELVVHVPCPLLRRYGEYERAVSADLPRDDDGSGSLGPFAVGFDPYVHAHRAPPDFRLFENGHPGRMVDSLLLFTPIVEVGVRRSRGQSHKLQNDVTRQVWQALEICP